MDKWIHSSIVLARNRSSMQGPTDTRDMSCHTWLSCGRLILDSSLDRIHYLLVGQPLCKVALVALDVWLCSSSKAARASAAAIWDTERNLAARVVEERKCALSCIRATGVAVLYPLGRRSTCTEDCFGQTAMIHMLGKFSLLLYINISQLVL